MRIKITLRELESLLQQQKEKVIDRLAGNNYLYNTESTMPLSIDKDKTREVGMKTQFPDDFNVLNKFISDE